MVLTFAQRDKIRRFHFVQSKADALAQYSFSYLFEIENEFSTGGGITVAILMGRSLRGKIFDPDLEEYLEKDRPALKKIGIYGKS